MNKVNFAELTKGIFKENPTFVMLLGMCPTLGVTTSAINGMGMGLATMFVLILSNILISAVKNLIPDLVRIPCYIVIIASLVTIVELIIKAYFPSLHAALGIFLPLIVVNCIILGRAEAFASKNNVINSFLDALGMGIGFTLALTLLGALREALGLGSVFGWRFLPEGVDAMNMFIMPPGAFLALAALLLLFNEISKGLEK